VSTGADCRFYEKEAGQWYYDLQQWPYGETEDYDTSGPFPTFKAAYDHLHRYNANPGGFWINPLPGCKHDLARPQEWVSKNGPTHSCDRCGAHFTPNKEVA